MGKRDSVEQGRDAERAVDGFSIKILNTKAAPLNCASTIVPATSEPSSPTARVL